MTAATQLQAFSGRNTHVVPGLCPEGVLHTQASGAQTSGPGVPPGAARAEGGTVSAGVSTH